MNRVGCWLVLWMIVLSGCGGERVSKSVVEARKALRLENPQAALDALSSGTSDDTPEGHYLRAVAFDRMDRLEAAKAEIQLAIEKAPKVVKYAAFSERLKLFGGDDAAMDALIKLHEENPSSAAVSHHAVFAFQAKHVRLRTQGKLRAARVQLEKAQGAIKVALALAGEIPEFHRELIGQSLWFEQPDDSLKLVDALLKDSPNDVELLRDRIKIFHISKRPAEAIEAAANLYRQLDRTELAAIEFATTLHQLPPSPSVIEQMESLREAFPENIAILLRYCWTLSRVGQTKESCELIDAEIVRREDVRQKKLLAHSVVAIPLESNDPDLASAELAKHSDLIGSGPYREFVAGRLALLQQNPADALQHFQAVLTIQQGGGNVSRDLVHETLVAIRRLLVQEKLADSVRKAAEMTLHRAGLSRRDEELLRDEAKSLLNLLESESPAPTEEPSKSTDN